MKPGILGLVVVVLAGCASKPNMKNVEAVPSNSSRSYDRPRAEELLGQLNECETKYGNLLRKQWGYDVPGEANAMMADLKKQIFNLGYEAVWHGDAGYVLAEIRR